MTEPMSDERANELLRRLRAKIQQQAETIRGHEEAMRTERRDRDALWCEALAVSLDSEKIEAVTRTFNKLRKRFPVLMDYRERRAFEDCPRSIPWELVEPHEHQALRNHSQTLARLAERGGCGPDELVAILEHRAWSAMPMRDAIDRLKQLVQLEQK